MRNNNLQTIFFILMMMAIFSGNFSGIFPLMIIFFIAKSIVGGQDRRDPRDPREDNRNRRRYSNRERNRQDQGYEPRESEYERRRRAQETRRQQQARPQPKPRQQPKVRNNPYKQSGVRKFKDYDYEGAVEDFVKALEIDATDVAVHFNIACCYSLNEEKDNAFYHLSKAVALGFKDFERIQSHDALAYIRIQDEFEDFKRNGYRTVNMGTNVTASTSEAKGSGDLLDQLKKLQELRERGVLTEEEFVLQKEKLLR